MKIKGKDRNNRRIPELHLRYLFDLSTKTNNLNLNKSKCKIFISYCNKIQYPLQKLKRIICRKCKLFLIPKINSTVEFIKRENGLCFEIKCNECNNVSFIVKRNEKNKTEL